MADHVPAWKRLGLKVKETLEEEDNQILSITHLDSDKLTSKQVKKVKKRQREEESTTEKKDSKKAKSKKPAKRKKLPKNERPPPPEKDQLVYLKQFSLDRDNWKFSKQKQNWILKNIEHIGDEYEQYLMHYLKDLQGGSRDRLIGDMEKVINLWNECTIEAERKLKEKMKQAAENEDEDKSEEVEDKDKSEEVESKEEKAKENEKKPPSYAYVIRARKVYNNLSGKNIFLHTIDSEEDSSTSNVILEEVEVTEYVEDQDLK